MIKTKRHFDVTWQTIDRMFCLLVKGCVSNSFNSFKIILW